MTLSEAEPPPAGVSRRRFLLAGAVLGGAATLGVAGCSGSTSSGSSKSATGGFSGNLTLLLPGEVPVGWDHVLEQVNAKLTKDLGFRMDPQFIPWDSYAQQSVQKFTDGATF